MYIAQSGVGLGMLYWVRSDVRFVVGLDVLVAKKRWEFVYVLRTGACMDGDYSVSIMLIVIIIIIISSFIGLDGTCTEYGWR